MAVTYNIKGTSQSSFKVGKGGAGTVEIGGIDASGAVSSTASITGHLVPSANITYDLGTSSLMWRDVYVGPGSIYVNGKKVIEDNSGTITVSTDADQNLAIATSGTGQTTIQSVAGLNLTTTSTGDITFTTALGQVNFDGDVIVNAAKSISSSNSNPITFADPISVSGTSSMTNLTVTGDLTVQGSTTTIDSTTIAVTNSFTFEGATADDFETTLTVTDPTADRTITLPDATGTVVLQDSTDTLSNKTLTTPDVNTSLKMVSGAQLQFRDNQSYITENGGILLFNGAAGRGVRMYSDGAERVAVSYDGNLELKTGVDIVFEGATSNDFETTLTVTDPTADRTITLPNATGTVVLADATQTLTNKTLGATTISGHLTPSANVTYDLGTSSLRFRDIYLSGTTIDLGGAKLTNDGSDNLDIKDSSGNRKIIRASAIELVDSSGKKMKLERDATSGKLKKTRKNADDSDEGSTDTLDIVGDSSPQLGGTLDANGNDIDMGTNTITDTKVGQWDTAYGWGDHSTAGYQTTAGLNAAVDTHLNQSNPTSGYVLSWNGSDYAWVEQSGGGGTYSAQGTAPSSPNDGDEWYDTDTGDFYKYINDGTTSQWVEWSPAGGALGFTGGSYNSSTGVVTFTSDDGLGFSTGDLRGADGADGAGASLDGTTAITGDILPDTTNTRDLGSSSYKYAEIHATTFYGTATTAQYADLAEMYAGDQAYEPGTVVVVGGTHEVTQCTKHLDSSLAGVVSEKPGYLMNKDIDAEYPVCVGFVGRVPVKVVGHIQKGDLLTTSSIPGFATKYTKGTHEPGCIIGVALNTKQEIGEGTVEVLLKRS